MRIAYLTQWFEPEPNIVKGVAFVRALETAGHEVTVVTGFPNYPEGRIYPGYRLRLIRRETIDGVKVVRLPLYPSHDRSSLRRSLNFLSFFVSAVVWLLFNGRKFDLAYVYHPPITVGLAAALARIPFVLDVQDLWPDTIAATGMPGASRLMGPLGACCRFVYRRASAILTQSEGMLDALIARGVPASKVSVVRNWADAEFHDIRPPSSKTQPFTLVYGGNFGRAQQLEHVIEAAAILQRARPDIQIDLYGGGVDEGALRDRAEGRDLHNLQLHGRVPRQEIVRAFAGADALLLHLGDDPLFDITIPSKTQFYLAMGKPVVAAVNGETGQLLRASGASIVVPPADPPALAGAIAKMADIPRERRERMGQSGADYYRRHLSFSAAMNRTLAVLDGTYETVRAGQGRR
jgi:colanic acid biosynthesis glycosyl transferase WcaI